MDGAVGDLAVISGRKWISFATGRGTARFAVVDRFACVSPNPRSRQEWTTRGRPCATGTSVDLRATTRPDRSEEHTSELQSLMRTSYAVFCLKKTKSKH